MAGHPPLTAPAILHKLVMGILAFTLGLGIASARAEADRSNARAQFAAVERWLLLLNNELDAATVQRIAASRYDMAVVDFTPSLSWNAKASMAGTVVALRHKPDGGRRLVVAYLNVGQAEDYRSYFRPEWKKHPPSWIVGADPEGWQGDSPVAYWRPEWQEIVAGPQGLARSIASAGFDGAYLDWVAGYMDDAVLARARTDHVDARSEMVRLLRRVAAAARAVNPDFLLIVQNAPELASEPGMAAIADAFVQENIWFDGAENNKPPGDCPLPRTRKEAGTPAYFARLPAACRRAHATGHAGTLDFAQEEFVLPLLKDARARGFAVFTVDYALQPANIAAAVRRSRALGFKPFVGARALDTYREPAF